MRTKHKKAVLALLPRGLAASAQLTETPVKVLTRVVQPAREMAKRRFSGRVVAREAPRKPGQSQILAAPNATTLRQAAE
jgi:hypothetical protein